MAQTWCSTPLGVTDFSTYGAQLDPNAPVVCSTPLGVTDFSTLQMRMNVTANTVCSPPLGVTDVSTPAGSPAATPASGAQRLSASLTSPHDRAPTRRRAPGVLNASRRH